MYFQYFWMLYNSLQDFPQGTEQLETRQKQTPQGSSISLAYTKQHFLLATQQVCLQYEQVSLRMTPVWCCQTDAKQEAPVVTELKNTDFFQRDDTNRIMMAIYFLSGGQLPEVLDTAISV